MRSKKMENHDKPSPAEGSPAKKRPRIPFKHKISVKPADLDEHNAPDPLDAEMTMDDLNPAIDLDLEQETLLQDDPYFKTADFDEDFQEGDSQRETDADDFDQEGEDPLEDLREGSEEDYFGFEEPDTSDADESRDLY